MPRPSGDRRRAHPDQTEQVQRDGWTLAEAAGEVSPDGMQRLLRAADWNADAVRDQLCSYVVGSSAQGGC